MSNHHSSFALPSEGHGHRGPMEYINCILDRYSRGSQRQHHGDNWSPQLSLTTTKQARFPRTHQSDAIRHHRRTHRHKMISFNGPWSQDLDTFRKSVQSMPDQYKSSFASASKNTLKRLCNPDVLHVWESDSDIDNLLQLTFVIAKLCNLGTRKVKGTNANDGSMLIIAEEKSGRNNFLRICQLVAYLTGADGKEHLEGTVAAFGTIVVVKGWNHSIRSDTGTREAEATVKRISTSIERVFRKGNFASGKKKLVWHHGAVVHFLLRFINTTTSNIRSAFHAISVTGSLDLTDAIKPSPTGRTNTLPDLSTLESYAKKLDVPVVFLDPASQFITSEYLATYMYYYAYYINTFLPSLLSRPHLHKAQDELVTFAFQILGASKSKYGDNVVRLVQDHLHPKAQKWARTCINSTSYTKPACRRAGASASIHHAVQLADSPFAPFTHGTGLTAFSRLAVGPAATTESLDHYTAAPCHISFSQSRIRPSSPSTFHILIAAPSQDAEKVTNRIQGLMMAVLERVRQEKGNPEFSTECADMWRAVTKSCLYALDASKGKMPSSVEEKVKFVRDKLIKGTWGFAMGVGGGAGEKDGGGDGHRKEEEGVSGAAQANYEAVKRYGGGGSAYGQVGPQQQMGYAGMGFGQGQHVMQQGQQGLAAPPNSPGLGQQMGGPQMGAFAPPHAHGLGPGYGAHAAGYAQQGHGVGGGGYGLPQQGDGGGRGYPQSMGGNWL